MKPIRCNQATEAIPMLLAYNNERGLLIRRWYDLPINAIRHEAATKARQSRVD